jgi:hypothetical protein
LLKSSPALFSAAAGIFVASGIEVSFGVGTLIFWGIIQSRKFGQYVHTANPPLTTRIRMIVAARAFASAQLAKVFFTEMISF